MLSNIRGTHDILDLQLFNFVHTKIQHVLTCNNFKEISTPILEPTELFKRSLGLQTDVVQKQMFTIQTQNSDEQICLRPEVTASTLRAFLANESRITQRPWKVFQSGPMFRYERPQKGRFREFHQCNIEIIDAKSITYDVYFIALLDNLFHHTFFLEDYGLALNFLGCTADRTEFKKILYEYLAPLEQTLCPTCLVRKETNILRIFDCKSSVCQELYQKAPHIADHLCDSCQKEWNILKSTLDLLSVSFSYVPTLVRGLDYYDKTVFEFMSGSLGTQSAFCSGGRYDHLATYLGYKTDFPSLGAAIGIERLLLLLEPISQRLSLEHTPAIQLIIPLSTELQELALIILQELQSNNICSDILLDGESLKSMMRKADKMGAQHVIFVGSEEQKSGTVKIKNMQTGQEESIIQAQLINFLKK